MAFSQDQQRKTASAQADAASAAKQLKDYQDARVKEQMRPGLEVLTQNQFEKQAGVTPPSYEGARDINTGALLDQYKINPFAGEASKKIREESLTTGPSEWAKNALGRQGFEEKTARGNVGLQQQTAQSQGQAALMRQGGLGGGARTSLARSGARDALMANQGVANAGVLARYGINDQDMQRRQALLGTTADVERQGDLQNLTTTQADLQRKAAFDANRYNQQMGAWGAKQSADATRAAGSGGGGKK